MGKTRMDAIVYQYHLYVTRMHCKKLSYINNKKQQSFESKPKLANKSHYSLNKYWIFCSVNALPTVSVEHKPEVTWKKYLPACN